MSVAQMKLAAAVPVADCGPKCVLLCLAWFADDSGGSCYPTLNRIAGWCSLSQRGVRDAIRHLESIGLVSTQITSGKVSNYQLSLPGIIQPRQSVPHLPRQSVPGFQTRIYTSDQSVPITSTTRVQVKLDQPVPVTSGATRLKETRFVEDRAGREKPMQKPNRGLNPDETRFMDLCHEVFGLKEMRQNYGAWLNRFRSPRSLDWSKGVLDVREALRHPNHGIRNPAAYCISLVTNLFRQEHINEHTNN